METFQAGRVWLYGVTQEASGFNFEQFSPKLFYSQRVANWPSIMKPAPTHSSELGGKV